MVIVPSLAADRHDVATRTLLDVAPLVALSMLVHDDIDPLVEHFLTTISHAVSPRNRAAVADQCSRLFIARSGRSGCRGCRSGMSRWQGLEVAR